MASPPHFSFPVTDLLPFPQKHGFGVGHTIVLYDPGEVQDLMHSGLIFPYKIVNC